MRNFLLEQQQKEERIAILTGFIHSNPEARELKRALAVKKALEGEAYSKISKLLWINKSYITIGSKNLIFLSCISMHLVCNSFKIAI
jgi:putative transposase